MDAADLEKLDMGESRLMAYRVTLLEARMLASEAKIQKAIYLLLGNLIGIIVILIEQYLRLVGKI